MPGEIVFFVSYAALWVLVAFQTLVLLELVRRPVVATASATNELDLPPPRLDVDMLQTGTPSPDFAAPSLESGELVSNVDLRGQRTLLVFVAPTCATCHMITEEIAAFRASARAQLVAICRGDRETCAEMTPLQLPRTLALLDESGSIAKSFLVTRTPTAVLLDDDGRILRYGFPRSVPYLGVSDMLGERDTATPAVSPIPPTPINVGAAS